MAKLYSINYVPDYGGGVTELFWSKVKAEKRIRELKKEEEKNEIDQVYSINSQEVSFPISKSDLVDLIDRYTELVPK